MGFSRDFSDIHFQNWSVAILLSLLGILCLISIAFGFRCRYYANMKAAQLKICGIVQGVGFRPAVYRYAVALNLKGFVRNDSQGVFIHAEGKRLGEFILGIEKNLPPSAQINDFQVLPVKPIGYRGFEIISSENMGGIPTAITPDLATCSDCARELFDPQDRRYLYPFINCTNCGPRYSIVQRIPYDRPNTTMSIFHMCEDCSAEYKNPIDRRFHAQPDACATCGPQYTLLDSDGKMIESKDPIAFAAKAIESGSIIAVKGIGGFHLMANAFDKSVVAKLRLRKNRPNKPFAIMARDLDAVGLQCNISEDEAEELKSPRAPIVLLKKKIDCTLPESIAPDLDRIGIFLPYAPVHYLLFNSMSIDAIIATSGNRRDEPIICDNNEAVSNLDNIADMFLVHNRDIVGRSDDSLGFVFKGDYIVIRRSRGYVPKAIKLPVEGPSVLAVGADLKGTFCLTRGNEAFLSPYLGDLQGAKSSEYFDEVLARYLEWLDIQPEVIISDLHPDYVSTIKGEKLARQLSLPFLQIQHHYAHILSAIAEHQLADRPILGIALDGYGYGADGTIWGGEFLISDYNDFSRVCHITCVPQPGGDRAAVDVRRMALSWLQKAFGDCALDYTDQLFKPKIENGSTILELIRQNRPPLTSSAGRLFDSISAISGVCSYNSFEGECPQKLMAAFDSSIDGAYEFGFDGKSIDPSTAVISATKDAIKNESPSLISTRFHRGFANALVLASITICREHSIKKVILTGGVFQNIVLLGLVAEGLRENGLEPHWNKQIPPGDAGLAIGQALYGLKKLSID